MDVLKDLHLPCAFYQAGLGQGAVEMQWKRKRGGRGGGGVNALGAIAKFITDGSRG